MFYASSPAQPYLCREDELPFGQPDVQYSMFPDYHLPSSDKFVNSAAGETRTVFHPTMSSQLHPRRLFTRQNNEGSIRPLNPHLFSSYQHQVYQSSPPFTNVPPHHQWEESSQSWVQNYHPIPLNLKQNEGQLPYPSFPSPSHFPPTRLSPRPLHHAPFHAKGSTQSHRITLSGNRLAFTESVDLNTGLLLRTPEHPRLRTAQACEKCRVRKAKCSGEHPKCKRCCDRNLNCEYAKEGRVRGPNKPKAKISGSPSRNEPSPVANNAISGRSSRARTSSATSSTGSSGHPETPTTNRSFISTSSDLNPKSSRGRSTSRNSMSLDISAQARPADFILDSESGHFRRPNSARPNITLLTGNDYFFLQREETQSGSSDPRGFVNNKPCVRQTEQHYDLHGNSLIMQGDCRVIGLPPSPLRRLARGSGPGGQYQPENPLYAINQSELVPLGLNDVVAQNDSIHTPDSVFPSSQGFGNAIHVRHPQQDEGSAMLNGTLSMPDTNHCTPSISCAGGGVMSSIGSPLTPTSTSSSSVPFLPNISRQNTSHLQLPEMRYDSVNRSGPPFNVEPPLVPLQLISEKNLTPEPRLAQESYSPRAEQNNGLGYHPTLGISNCTQNS